MRDMKIGLQESDTWKIQLTMSNVDEDSVMHTKSENKELWFMIMQMTLLMNFSRNLETTMERS